MPLVSMLAWTTGFDVLGAVGVSPVRPHVAAAIIALAAAIVLLGERPSRVVEWMTRALSASVVVAGFLAFWQYVASTGIGGSLPFAGPTTGFPDGLRMEPASALTLVLLGSSLTLYDLRSERLHHVAEMLVLVAGVIAFETLLEHAFGMDSLYGLVGTFPVAPVHTALSLLVLSVGAASLRPHRGWFQMLVDPGTAGVTVRRLIPVSVVAPFLVGWLTYLGVSTESIRSASRSSNPSAGRGTRPRMRAARRATSRRRQPARGGPRPCDLPQLRGDGRRHGGRRQLGGTRERVPARPPAYGEHRSGRDGLSRTPERQGAAASPPQGDHGVTMARAA